MASNMGGGGLKCASRGASSQAGRTSETWTPLEPAAASDGSSTGTKAMASSQGGSFLVSKGPFGAAVRRASFGRTVGHSRVRVDQGRRFCAAGRKGRCGSIGRIPVLRGGACLGFMV